MIAVSARAGMPLWIPEDISGHCCATIWHSKGYVKGNAVMANRTAESLWRWSDSGRLPIVCDASSCSFGISQRNRRVSDAGESRAPRAADDSRLGRLGARSAAAKARNTAQGRARQLCTRAARPVTSSSRTSCMRSRPRWPTRR